jgi:hypothetical protein
MSWMRCRVTLVSVCVCVCISFILVMLIHITYTHYTLHTAGICHVNRDNPNANDHTGACVVQWIA